MATLQYARVSTTLFLNLSSTVILSTFSLCQVYVPQVYSFCEKVLCLQRKDFNPNIRVFSFSLLSPKLLKTLSYASRFIPTRPLKSPNLTIILFCYILIKRLSRYSLEPKFGANTPMTKVESS